MRRSIWIGRHPSFAFCCQTLHCHPFFASLCVYLSFGAVFATDCGAAWFQDSARDSTGKVVAAQSSQPDEAIVKSYQAVADSKKANFEKLQRLAAVGSVSQQKWRRVQFEYQRSQLELLSIQQPERHAEIELAISKLDVEHTETELGIVARLFERGSASKLELERAQVAYDLAAMNLKVVRQSGSRTLLDVRIAQRRLELVKVELEMAKQLVKTRSISQSAFEKIQQRFENARAEVQLAKRALGVIVKQIESAESERDK